MPKRVIGCPTRFKKTWSSSVLFLIMEDSASRVCCHNGHLLVLFPLPVIVTTAKPFFLGRDKSLINKVAASSARAPVLYKKVRGHNLSTLGLYFYLVRPVVHSFPLFKVRYQSPPGLLDRYVSYISTPFYMLRTVGGYILCKRTKSSQSDISGLD